MESCLTFSKHLYPSRCEYFRELKLNVQQKTFVYTYRSHEDYMTGMDSSDFNIRTEIDIIEGIFLVTKGSFSEANWEITCQATSANHETEDEAYNFKSLGIIEVEIKDEYKTMSFKCTENTSVIQTGIGAAVAMEKKEN